MKRVPAFWDTSLLLPLCVMQSTTGRAVELYKIHNVVVWWATPVEIASALSRLLRMRQLDARERNEADKLAKKLADSWSVIQPSNKVLVAAMQLVKRYDLRAADSLQLAAALEWCEGQAQGRIFLTTDHKLREAAMLSGFDVP